MEEMILTDVKESEVERNSRIMRYISQDENAVLEVVTAVEKSGLAKNRDMELLRNLRKSLEEKRITSDEVVVLLGEIGGRSPEFLAFIVAYSVYRFYDRC